MHEPHWDMAGDAARAAGVELRPLTQLEDADRILEVMIATWGEHQLIPRELIRALQESGNTPYGAFAGGQMIGYVLGFLGDDEEGPHLHSHMLAVLPGRRSKGVGYALKMAQRGLALDAGVHVARWTFDPLLARNAYFNLAKLGATADRFHRDFYGEMQDVLNRGERTDRLVVRWDLDRETSGPAPEEGFEVLGRDGPPDVARPRLVVSSIEGPALVRIPHDYPKLRERDPALADEWREASGVAFEACFGAGMTATGFTADASYAFE